jgi:hypothetical protein
VNFRIWFIKKYLQKKKVGADTEEKMGLNACGGADLGWGG